MSPYSNSNYLGTIYTVHVYVNEMSPYSNSNYMYLSSTIGTVSNYCLTTVVLN